MKTRMWWALAALGGAAAFLAVSAPALLRSRSVGGLVPSEGSIVRSGEAVPLRPSLAPDAAVSSSAVVSQPTRPDAASKREAKSVGEARRNAVLSAGGLALPGAAMATPQPATLADRMLRMAAPYEQDEAEASAFNTEAYDRIVDNGRRRHAREVEQLIDTHPKDVEDLRVETLEGAT